MEIEIATNNRKWGESIRHATVTVDVKLSVHKDNRYYVTRRSNGHQLGWVIKSTGYQGAIHSRTFVTEWIAYVDNAAYWPADADIMTRTDRHPTHRADSGLHGEKIATTETRQQAVEEIVWTLLQRSAEAVQPDFEAAFPTEEIAR